MSNESSNSILNYIGEVSMVFERNGRPYEVVRHNAGLPKMFNIIARALTGKNVAEEIPAFLDLRYLNGSTYVTCLRSPVVLTGCYYENDITNGWVTKVTGTITFDNLDSPIVDNTYKLYLMSKTGRFDLATLEVDYDDLKNLTAGTQALITWTLRFQNLNGRQDDEEVE